MTHKIPLHRVNRYTQSISDPKRTQVSRLQNHIQEILGQTHHTFLQGSYKNDTCTSDINDVDVVAVRLTTYSSVHSTIRASSSVTWDAIFTEIEQRLEDQDLYQWSITRKDKCIEIQTPSFKADVVPAVQVESEATDDPIVIYSSRNGTEKVNYPRTHYDNGVAKHKSTSENYKPLVRMFKNWTAAHFEDSDVAPSYHIESLVYGAPDKLFSSDHAASFILIGDHITKLLSQRDLLPVQILSVCGSEDITSHWNITSRSLFKDTLKQSVRNGFNAYQAPTAFDAGAHWDKTFNI